MVNTINNKTSVKNNNKKSCQMPAGHCEYYAEKAAKISELAQDGIPEFPMLSKYQMAFLKTENEIRLKYTSPYQKYVIPQSLEEVSKSRIGNLVEYIKETKLKYSKTMRSGFAYNPKFDNYLFVICCEMVRNYYGDEKFYKILLKL